MKVWLEITGSALGWAPLFAARSPTAEFDTSVDGKISSKADVYVTLWCWQDDNAVYQYTMPADYSFPLEDLGGQNLVWDGGDASCEARLIYRVDMGKRR